MFIITISQGLETCFSGVARSDWSKEIEIYREGL